MTDNKATPAEKLQYWLDFAEANRPGHDSLRGVSYEPAPIRQAWIADVLTAFAAERDRTDRLADIIKRARQSGDPEFPEADDAVEMWRILSEATA